jgi:SAM-dependent methyltransferase
MVDPDARALSQVAGRRLWVHVVAATAESLPFDPGCFDTVLSIQNFHTFAPGLALGEWARVLKPAGRVGLAYITRDDSVPWVKKLKRIVQSYLPSAMSHHYMTDSFAALNGSMYFPVVRQTSFRLWVPSTRSQLQDSALNARGAGDLPAGQLDTMLEEIGRLYDEYARIPDPLLLPYQIRCWGAEVDQSELTSSVIAEETGLHISL